MLDDYAVAALKVKGYCTVLSPGDCPAIWALFKTSKSVEAARSNITMRGMEEWSEETGNDIFDIDTMFLTEENVKDIIIMRNKPITHHHKV